MDNIDFCSLVEKEALIGFIKSHWSESHILTKSNEILDFQHREINRYNFIISKNQKGAITGILGFIPLSKYDNSLKENSLIWLAIWKVNHKVASNGVGFRLLNFLETNMKPKLIGAIGINDQVANLYSKLKYRIGLLNHYYILNQSISENKFEIAKIIKPIKKKVNKKVKNRKIGSVRELKFHELQKNFFINYCHKTKKYFENRYLSHPIYNYRFCALELNRQTIAYFVIRKIKHGNRNCIRIVDLVANKDIICNVSDSIQLMLEKFNSEYIDCYNFGINENVFKNWGFNKKNENHLILPNYFEPFERNNIQIKFAIKSNINNYEIFKGDSDQDRPNRI